MHTCSAQQVIREGYKIRKSDSREQQAAVYFNLYSRWKPTLSTIE